MRPDAAASAGDTVTSPGQQRLRELVTDAAPDVLKVIEPSPGTSIYWRHQSVHAPLLALRETALADELVRADPITGQDLRRPPVSRTYAVFQHASIPGELASSYTIDADAVLYHQATHEPLACGGGFQGTSTYAALTWLALGRALEGDALHATVLAGSKIVVCGGNGNHRTLACFLWGHAQLNGAIMVADDVPDDALHTACRLIDSRLPRPREGLDLPGELAVTDAALAAGHPERRDALLHLADRLRELPPLTQPVVDAAAGASRAQPTLDILDRAIDVLNPPAAARGPWWRRRRPA
jgi:hypothetical protein